MRLHRAAARLAWALGAALAPALLPAAAQTPAPASAAEPAATAPAPTAELPARMAWTYRSYKRDSLGRYNKDNYTVGTIAVERREGQEGRWSFRMLAGAADVCYGRPLPATVTRTETRTVIEVSEVPTGCEAFRYTIRNDGRGGYKESREPGGEWRRSPFNHGLTPEPAQ